MINVDLLKKICETAGAPGFENRVRDLVLKEIEDYVDSIEIDNMGNIIGLKKGKDSSKSVMIGAHMDEIGFIVTHINAKGFLKFHPLGGFDPKTLTAQRVIVLNFFFLGRTSRCHPRTHSVVCGSPQAGFERFLS